jgi:curved DNA-binding protein CbpA
MRDHYEVLQVHPRAEPEVIRAAYRALARKYHPDLGGSPRRMIELNDAWDVLGDAARRAEYDASRVPASDRREPEHPFASAPAPSGPSTRPGTDAARAGPPPGRPSGTVLDFGRYAGWSLGEIARHDRDYLEWLQRATVGRRLRAELDILLRQNGGTAGPASAYRGWRSRR